MIYNGTIEKKIRFLEDELEMIEDWEITNYSKFKKSSLEKAAVEKALTVCVQIMIDICERILAINKKPPKNTTVENLEQIVKLKAIKSSEKYIEIFKFRNFVVHRYENIDPAITFNIVKNELNLYREFIDEIRIFCSNNDKKEKENL